MTLTSLFSIAGEMKTEMHKHEEVSAFILLCRLCLVA